MACRVPAMAKVGSVSLQNAILFVNFWFRRFVAHIDWIVLIVHHPRYVVFLRSCLLEHWSMPRAVVQIEFACEGFVRQVVRADWIRIL